jgi:hypothetical protein
MGGQKEYKRFQDGSGSGYGICHTRIHSEIFYWKDPMSNPSEYNINSAENIIFNRVISCVLEKLSSSRVRIRGDSEWEKLYELNFPF